MASSTTSSSPLFEQPFAEMHFYSSNNDNDNSKSGRLRRRENDSLQHSSPVLGTSPLLGTHSQQQPPPQYYSHAPRRKSPSNSVDRWVPRLFKAILWSPLIVVVLWTSSAVLFTRSAPRKGSVQVRPPSSKTMKATSKMQQQQYSRGESVKEGFISGMEVLGAALGKEQPQQMVPLVVQPLGQAAPPQGNSFANFVHGIGNMVNHPKQGAVIVQPANLQQNRGLPLLGNVQLPPPMQYEGVYQQNGQGNYPQQQQQQPVMQYEGIYQQNGQGNYPQQQQSPAMQYEGMYQQNGQGNYPQQQQSPAMQYGVVYVGGNQNGNNEQANAQQDQPQMQYGVVYVGGNQNGNSEQANAQQDQPQMQYGVVYVGGENQQGNAKQDYVQQDQPAMQYGVVYVGGDQQGNMQGNAQQNQPAMQYDGMYMQNGQGNYPQQQQQPAVQLSGGKNKNHLRGGTQYLYYNPRDVVYMNGQMYLPSQAYDKNGKPYDLTRTKSQVFIQPPPPYGVHHFNASAYNVTDTNYTWTYFHPNVVKSPVFGSGSHDSGDKEQQSAKGISMPNLQPVEGNSSSILVATVGVVALLVGALSARHARGRACLNACLENETLASEAAYDTAHTRANTYSTFWKGDLEKFDV